MGLTDAYLRLHPPRRKPNTPGGGQYRPGRRLDRSPLPGEVTGCTVLHTAEGAMDTVGVDTGAENVARFIQRRTDAPGSYHDIADSDSYVHVVRYGDEAYQDGTGSNPWALSISFACRTVDWERMGAAKRAAFMACGAQAFAAQQAWRRANGYPLTELRLISSWMAEQGESGFVYHGARDPGRRTDPGTTSAAPFPIIEFIDACRAATTSEEDTDMALSQSDRLQLRADMLEQANKAVAPALAGLKSVSRQVADLDASVDTEAVVAKLDKLIESLRPEPEAELEAEL